MSKTIATVADFEKLKNELGLVAMSFLLPTITEKVGDVRGAEPYTALRWYNDGLAEPVNGLDKFVEKMPSGGVSSDALRRGAIEIPEKWAEEHHLKRITLAKTISGQTGSLSADDADAIIKAEVERRAAV